MRTPRPHHRAALLAALALVALLTAACGDGAKPSAGPSTTPRPALPSGFDSAPGLLLEPDPSGAGVARQLGTAHVQVSVVTVSGGQVTTGPGPDGVTAFRFPAFRARVPYPRAVLDVVPTGTTDPFDPGDQPFTFGANVRIDARSSLTKGVDNGDNVLQRGLSSEPTLFKVELDHDRPACIVRGTGGTAVVRANHLVVPGVWYRVRCSRKEEDVTLRVQVIDPSAMTGTGATDDQRTVTAPIGTVDFASSTVPISIGGKLDLGAKILNAASDQFNGWIADPMIQIGDPG